MCYPGADLPSAYTPASPHRQWVAAVEAAAQETARRQGTASNRGRLAEDGGGITRVCVCSPSSHPGSFRCRHHHQQYQWVSRL